MMFLKRIRESQIAKASLITIIGSGISKVIMFASTFIITHLLLQDAFGQFSFVRNTIEMILSICAVNYASLVVKFASEAQYHVVSFHRLILLFLFSFFICMIIGALILILPASILLRIFINEDLLNLFKFVGIGLPFFFIGPMFEGIYKAKLQFKLVSYIQIVIAVVYLLLTVAMTIGYGLKGALYSLLIFCFLRSVIYIVPLLKSVNISSVRSRCTGFTREKACIYNMILPTFVNSFIEAPVYWLAQLQLTTFGSFAYVASMTVIMQIRNIILIIPGYFFGTYISFASKLNASRDYKSYFGKYDFLLNKLTLVGTLSIALLAICGKFILALFGPEYVDAYFAFLIAAFCLPLLLISSLLRQHCIIMEHQKKLLVITLTWNGIWIALLWASLKYISISPLLSFFGSQSIAVMVFVILLLGVYHNDKYKLISEKA